MHSGPQIGLAPEYEAFEALKAVKAGHADDVDIAAQILANNLDVGDSWSLEEDKKLMRRVDWRLIPIVRHLNPQVYSHLTKL
jgi:hypothetical protein